MALYKYPVLLRQNKNRLFDAPSGPSTAAQCGGIDRCSGCGTEIAIEAREVLPGATHHRHSSALTPIQWQLIVATAARTAPDTAIVQPEEACS